MTDLIADVPDFDLSGGLRVEQIGIRKYPCCGIMQRVIDGMSDLVAEEKLRKEDVESIDVDVNPTFVMYVKYPEPVTAAQTRFSIEHAMAACFLEKRVFLSSFTDQAAHDPRYKEFRKKVHMKMHPEWEGGYFPQPTIITVRLKDGRVFKRDCVFARGDAGHPIAREDMKRKYDGGIEFNDVLSPAAAKRAVELIEGIEDVKDISQLTDIFVFPDRARTAAPERRQATQ
jgi:2-methylcitrate dehydratase PrpD